MAVRKNLCKLVEHVNMLNFHCTEDSPEYKLLDHLMDDDMIHFALSFKKIRTPYSIDELTEMSGYNREYVKELAEKMTRLGILEWEGEKVKLPIFAPGMMEIMMMDPELSEKHPEIAESFHTYVCNLTKGWAKFFPKGNGLVITLPVQKAIAAESKAVDIEQVSYWVDKYNPHMSVAPCQCRRAARQRGDIGEDMEGEWCIQLGEFAESCIRAGKSRRITKEEAYEIIYKAEEMGYVHEVTNVDGKENSLFICECHPEACLAMKTARLCDTPNMMKSNFEAQVNKNNCVACGQCVEVCPMNAVKLSKKLCSERPIQIKDKPVPDNTIWTKDHWTEDFRDTKLDVQPETGTSPCKTACPAHIAVQGYLKLANQGRYAEALELIKKENPLPAVCGRICNKRCEEACTLNKISDSVAIDDVKKFIAELEMKEEYLSVPKKKYPADADKKVAIIGAGPAGITCAYYAAIYGLQVTVFEKQEKAGGMLRYGIPSFRLEKDVIDAELKALEKLGVTFRYGVEVGKDITLDDLRKDGYKAFYIAIGAQAGRYTNTPGENAKGVMTGIDFLREVNTNQKQILTGDTIVVGGGNVAVDVARSALRVGSKKVSMYCLETMDIMPASKEEIEEAKAEGIEINPGWGPKEVLQDEDGNVKAVVFKKCLSVRNAEGKFSPTYDENDTVTVEAKHLLLSVGQGVEWGHLLDGSKVELKPNKYVIADSLTYQTNEPDVFVGGDIYHGPKFAIDAIATGKEGANSLHRYVNENHSLTIGRDRRIYHMIDKDNIVLDSYDKPARQRAALRSKELSFKDNRGTLTEEQIKLETSRCLSCGVARVDASRCIGCGLCTTRCKFDAISLHKVSSEYGVPYEKLVPRLAPAVVKRAGKIVIRPVTEALKKKEEV